MSPEQGLFGELQTRKTTATVNSCIENPAMESGFTKLCVSDMKI